MSHIFSHTFSYKDYSVDLLDEFFKPSDFEYEMVKNMKIPAKYKIEKLLSDLNEMITFFPFFVFSDKIQSVKDKLTSKYYWASCVWNLLCFAPKSYEKKYKLNYQTNFIDQPPIIIQTCLYCKNASIDIILCNICGNAHYCNMLCKRYDYDIHKYECFPSQPVERSQSSSKICLIE